MPELRLQRGEPRIGRQIGNIERSADVAQRIRLERTYDDDGPIARLDAPILHYSFESYADCIDKMTRYGVRGGEMLFANSKRASLLDVAVRPAWRFFRTYFLQAGFLDGLAGFEMAKARAYEGLVKYTRLWDLSTRRD